MCTLFLALSAIGTIIVSVINSNKVIRESIESRVAENRPLIDIRRYPEFPRKPSINFYLQIKNVGKGNAYNINYSYHYYDFFTKKIIFEHGLTHQGDECYTVLEPGKIFNLFPEEHRQRLNIRERDGLPFIWGAPKEDEIKRMVDSSLVACGVYVEYEDFKGNIFWTGRQFGIMNRPLPLPGPLMQYDREMTKARGPFMLRGRERVVKGGNDFLGPKAFERPDLIQTEKLNDTLGKKDLK